MSKYINKLIQLQSEIQTLHDLVKEAEELEKMEIEKSDELFIEIEKRKTEILLTSSQNFWEDKKKLQEQISNLKKQASKNIRLKWEEERSCLTTKFDSLSVRLKKTSSKVEKYLSENQKGSVPEVENKNEGVESELGNETEENGDSEPFVDENISEGELCEKPAQTIISNVELESDLSLTKEASCPLKLRHHSLTKIIFSKTKKIKTKELRKARIKISLASRYGKQIRIKRKRSIKKEKRQIIKSITTDRRPKKSFKNTTRVVLNSLKDGLLRRFQTNRSKRKRLKENSQRNGAKTKLISKQYPNSVIVRKPRHNFNKTIIKRNRKTNKIKNGLKFSGTKKVQKSESRYKPLRERMRKRERKRNAKRTKFELNHRLTKIRAKKRRKLRKLNCLFHFAIRYRADSSKRLEKIKSRAKLSKSPLVGLDLNLKSFLKSKVSLFSLGKRFVNKSEAETPFPNMITTTNIKLSRQWEKKRKKKLVCKAAVPFNRHDQITNPEKELSVKDVRVKESKQQMRSNVRKNPKTNWKGKRKKSRALSSRIRLITKIKRADLICRSSKPLLPFPNKHTLLLPKSQSKKLKNNAKALKIEWCKHLKNCSNQSERYNFHIKASFPILPVIWLLRNGTTINTDIRLKPKWEKKRKKSRVTSNTWHHGNVLQIYCE